jgi:hypothetical protein
MQPLSVTGLSIRLVLLVPAIANHAIFSLPHCCEGDPLELPFALERWSEILRNI